MRSRILLGEERVQFSHHSSKKHNCNHHLIKVGNRLEIERVDDHAQKAKTARTHHHQYCRRHSISMHEQSTHAYATTTGQDFLIMAQAISSKPNPPPRRRRRVRFASAITWADSSTYTFTSEEVSELWYGFSELTAFKAQVKQLAKSERTSLPSVQHPDGDSTLRGLEPYSAARQTYKLMAIRCTLSAHNQGMSTDDIALVASICSEWNEEMSRIQGFQDFCQVYQPSMLKHIPKVASVPSKFPFPLKKKRLLSPEEPTTNAVTGRRVRQRPSCPNPPNDNLL